MEVNNLTKIAISRQFLKGVAKKVLMGENRKEETLSVAVVDKKEMESLNSSYRNKQEPTDVLSFDLSCKILESKNAMGLGEVVICPEKIRENAEKYNIDFKKELTKVLIHGILHLLGYDHERSEKDAKIMAKKQDYYLANF